MQARKRRLFIFNSKMERFISHIILMSVLFVVFFLAIIWLSFDVFRSNASFTLPADTKSIVIGHSHPECAIDDAMLKETVNLATSAEAYFYSHQKLKRIIKNNPQIERVYLEFTNNQISSIMDDWTFGDEKQSHHMPKYMPFLSGSELELFVRASFDSFFGALLNSTRENFFRMISRDYLIADELGGYNELTRVMHFQEDSKEYTEEDQRLFKTLSEFNLSMLDSILKLVDEEEIEIIGIRSPQHKSIPDLLNESKFDSIKGVKFANYEFWDFNTLSLPDSAFADPGHLNAQGAYLYTGNLRKRVEAFESAKE